jgi:hypothetical protein
VNDRSLTRIVLQGCPLDVIERSRRHTEALIREFAFITASDADRSSVPARLLAIIERIRTRLTGLNEAIEEQLEAARRRGAETVDLAVMLPVAGRALAVELKGLFDEAEAFCRAGELLTLEESGDVHVFRDWYLQQYIDQLDGAKPEPWPDWRTARA